MYPPKADYRRTTTDPQFATLYLKPRTEPPKGRVNWRLGALSKNDYCLLYVWFHRGVLSPLSQCSGCLHSRAGIAPHPGDSPGRPCKEEWIHSNSTQANISRLPINYMSWKTLLELFNQTLLKVNSLLSNMILVMSNTSGTMVKRLTWDCALMSAPRLTRSFTTSAWPAREDMWSAVFPFWTNEIHKGKMRTSICIP